MGLSFISKLVIGKKHYPLKCTIVNCMMLKHHLAMLLQHNCKLFRRSLC